MFDNLVKNNYFLIIVLIISASIGWFITITNKYYTKIISPLSILALETFLKFIFFYIIVFLRGKNKYIVKDFHNLNYIDYVYFIILAFISISISLIWIEFLKHHSLKKIQSLHFVIDILVTLIAFTFIMKEDFTLKKLIGLPLMITGVYLINS
jgi:drug/metabolite transporter (DMT)-like permease